MKCVAWDTSSKTGALVAFEAQTSIRVVTELTLNVDSTHSERLLWGIHQLLESARWRLEEVDCFGVGLGPGSFTGLRIGVTTARTLAHAMRKPLIGVSSLAALARPVGLNFSQKGFAFRTHVLAVTDACKGELFCLSGDAAQVASCSVRVASVPQLWKKGVKEEVTEPLKRVEALEKMLSRHPAVRWVTVGEGRRRYEEIWKRLPRSREVFLPDEQSTWIQGRFLGQLVWEAFQAGLPQTLSDPLQVYPCYLRASDAELKLKAGILVQAPLRNEF